MRAAPPLLLAPQLPALALSRFALPKMPTVRIQNYCRALVHGQHNRRNRIKVYFGAGRHCRPTPLHRCCRTRCPLAERGSLARAHAAPCYMGAQTYCECTPNFLPHAPHAAVRLSVRWKLHAELSAPIGGGHLHVRNKNVPSCHARSAVTMEAVTGWQRQPRRRRCRRCCHWHRRCAARLTRRHAPVCPLCIYY